MAKSNLILGSVLSVFFLGLALPAASQEAEENRRAMIPFADIGGIDKWRAPDDYTLFVEARNGQWYSAELFGPCFGLSRAVTIGFVTNHDGSLDSFSSILVEGDRCYFRSFEEIPTPAPLPDR